MSPYLYESSITACGASVDVAWFCWGPMNALVREIVTHTHTHTHTHTQTERETEREFEIVLRG